MNKSRTLGKIASLLGGFDVFISYRHADAHGYAVELERVLESKGLMVFRDETEEDVGTPLAVFVKRACSARTFVIVVTNNVYQSRSVFEELSAYLESRIHRWYRKPFSRIIPINVNQVLSRVPTDDEVWNRLSDFVYVTETADALSNNTPSHHVVERLKRSSSFLKSWQRFSVIVLVLTVAAISAITVSTAYLDRILSQLSIAQETTTNLKAEGARLEAERRMLTVRNAAINQLNQDPLIAYRLAEMAYRLKPDPSNRRILLESLSSIDLAYQIRKQGVSVEASSEPFILLKNTSDEEGNYFVFDMRTHEFQNTNFNASRSWIFPTEESWKALSLDWEGSGAYAIPIYRLRDERGEQIGESVESRRGHAARFLTDSKVFFLTGKGEFLIWDLLTDERRFLEYVSGENIFGDSHFRDIYGALDTRVDGVSAAYDRDGLVLMDKDGKIWNESYTPVSFDPSSLYSSARWSADDEFLALNYFDRKRLGVWNPKAKFFHWLDPDGWVINSYAWSQAHHLLAFSGRTENSVDVTVEVVDAEYPKTSRRILHKSNVPVRSLAFLPGDGQLLFADRDSIIRIVNMSAGKLIGQGIHPDIRSLYSSKYGVYSSSENDFRVWNGKVTPMKNWIFLSTADRTYFSLGTADSHWQWLVVPYMANDNQGIEIRNVISGDVHELPAPIGPLMKMSFSPNAKWLILESINALWFYDTQSWESRKFGLAEDDHQFIDLLVTDDVVHAQVLGSNYHNDSSNKLVYVFEFNDGWPTFAGRNTSTGDEIFDKEDKGLEENIRGWDVGNLFQYRSTRLISIADSSWALYMKCRDQAFPRDCDVQFIPLDIDKLIEVYDSILWKPTEKELDYWMNY